jgi:hypothetical protein
MLQKWSRSPAWLTPFSRRRERPHNAQADKRRTHDHHR